MIKVLAVVTVTLVSFALGFPTQETGTGKNWVVLVAGSNGWYNYRHQVSFTLHTQTHTGTILYYVYSIILLLILKL